MLKYAQPLHNNDMDTLYSCPCCKLSLLRSGWYWTTRKRYKRNPATMLKDIEYIVESRQAYCIECSKKKQKEGYHDPMRKELKRRARLNERLRAIKTGERLKRAERKGASGYSASEAVKRHRQKHREKYNKLDSLYKKMKRSKAFILGWTAILGHYGNVCCGCGDSKTCVDHVIPLNPANPYTNTLSNLQPLCRSCNSQKSGVTYDHRPDKGRWILDNIPEATVPF